HSLGDLNAELAAVRVCEGRLHEICRRYGTERLTATFGAILEQGERLARQALRLIPNGVYEAEDFIDGDGNRDLQLPIRVRVTVEDEAMAIDLTGCVPQVPGPINCTYSATLSACKTIFKAVTDKDGESGLIATTDGDTYNYPVELIENKFPLRVERYRFHTEGGVGAGRFRGGFGLERVYRILTDDAFSYASIGRSIARPWGVAGGEPGTTNYLEIISGRRRFRGARLPHTTLKKGDQIRIVTGGGGGYGPPRERDPELVGQDVRGGLLTPQQALQTYGVVLKEDRTIDHARTAAQRGGRG